MIWDLEQSGKGTDRLGEEMMRKTDSLLGISKNHRFYMNEYECGAWAVIVGCGITYLIFSFYGIF